MSNKRTDARRAYERQYRKEYYAAHPEIKGKRNAREREKSAKRKRELCVTIIEEGRKILNLNGHDIKFISEDY